MAPKNSTGISGLPAASGNPSPGKGEPNRPRLELDLDLPCDPPGDPFISNPPRVPFEQAFRASEEYLRWALTQPHIWEQREARRAPEEFTM